MVRAEILKCLTGPGSQSNGLVDEGDSHKPLAGACSENSKSWCSPTLSKGILSFVSMGSRHENLDSEGSSNSGVVCLPYNINAYHQMTWGDTGKVVLSVPHSGTRQSAT